MKKIISIKEVLLQVTFVTTILLIASCNSQQKSQDEFPTGGRGHSEGQDDTNLSDNTRQANTYNQNNQTDADNRNNQADAYNQNDNDNQADNSDRNNQTDVNNPTNINNRDNQTENYNQNAGNEQSDQNADAQFLVKATEINQKEIHLGKLAQQKGEADHVKELGKMMEDAHTKSLADLTALANRKKMVIPTSPATSVKDAHTKFNEKSGNAFDKAYADMMVSGHKEAIAVFEKASTDSNDTEIKSWATSSLAELRMHLEHSIASQKKLDHLSLNK